MDKTPAEQYAKALEREVGQLHAELDRLRGAVRSWCGNHCQRGDCITCPLRDTGGRE